MKKTLQTISLLSIMIVSGFSFPSCDKIKDKFFPGFETAPAEIQISIPVVTSTSAQSSIATITTYLNMDSIIKAETLNAFSLRNVESIKIQELNLAMTNSDNENNFGNFENVSVSVHSNSNPNMMEIANAPAIMDENINKLLVAPVSAANLRSYMNGTEISYTISGKARRVTTKAVNCQLQIRFRMK